MTRIDVDRFRSLGFVVLRKAFDPAPLAEEVDEALDAGGAGSSRLNASAEAGITFRYLPMMVATTPVSLLHASGGGGIRRQWRVDYIRRPTNQDEEAVARAYFAAMFSPAWDGGYDVDAYPTYGEHWRRTAEPAVDPHLEALGADSAAMAEETPRRRRAP